MSFAGVLLAVLGVAFCSAASAQTAQFLGAQTTLQSNAAFGGVAVDANGNAYLSNSTNSSVAEAYAVNGVLSASPTITRLGSGYYYQGFQYQQGIAVDASGNVFVADYANSAVKEFVAVNGVIPSTPVIRTLGSGFSGPTGVAVDASGNVFVADYVNGAGAIKEITAASGYATVNTLGSGFSGPTGVAVDASGDVFVADKGNNRVKEIVAVNGVIPNSPTILTLSTGYTFNSPQGVAVDAIGNVYVADGGAGRIEEILALNGYVSATSNVEILLSDLSQPFAVAVDTRGNLFYSVYDDFNADQEGEVAYLRAAGANFGPVNVGLTSATITLSFLTTGSGTLGTPTALTQGVAGLDFAVVAGGSCTGAVTAGTYCTVNVKFTPTKPGLRSGAVELVNTSGTVIATGYVEGVGTAPQIGFAPAPQTTLGSNLAHPQGLAVDANNYLYIADTGNGVGVEIKGGTQSTLPNSTTYLAAPTGVAIDGAGNFFISDATKGLVKAVKTSGAPALANLGGVLDAPQGVAVDVSGNVYVADTGNDAIKEFTFASGYATELTLGHGFKSPSGVAVDSSNNVYVADTGNNAVKELIAFGGNVPSNPTINTLGSGFSAPQGVTVDALGNLFVADTGNNAVKELTAASGLSSISTLTSITAPTGVAIDGVGNIYIASSANKITELETSVAPTLAFGYSSGLNVQSADQTVTVENLGNADLTFEAPSALIYVNQSLTPFTNISPDYKLDTNVTCPVVSTGTATLGAGESCTLPVYFDPTITGYLPVELLLTDNSLNVNVTPYATQIIDIGGSGIEAQAIAFNDNLPATAYFSTGLTFTLSANYSVASSPEPVVFSVLSGPAYVSGTNGTTLNITGVGTVVVAANQAALTGSLSAAPQITQTIQILAGAQTLSFRTAPSTPVTFGTGLGLNQTLNAYSNSTSNGASAATDLPVSFEVISGPGTVGASSCGVVNTLFSCTAPLTINGAGTILIAANQAGNANFSAAPQITESIVVNQTPQTIAFTPLATPVVYTPALSDTLTATDATGSGLPITFSVLSGPALISGNTLTFTAAGTVIVAANQAGNENFAAAPQVTQSIQVTQGLQTINFTAPASPIIYYGSNITVQLATLASASSGLPVTFSIVSGPASVSGTYGATLTITGTGTVVIAANQAGNPYWSPAPQVTQSILVNPSPDFTVSVNPTAVTISDGNIATTSVTVTPLNDFNAAVTLACTNLPANTTCSFAPATVTPNGGIQSPEGGAASSLLTINTSATVGSNNSHPFLPVTSLALVLGLFGIRKRRKLQMLLLVAVSIIGLGVFTGCGGVSGSSSSPTTSSITVTATSGTAGATGYVQHTTTFLLTVK